jgi:hypothetical protein
LPQEMMDVNGYLYDMNVFFARNKFLCETKGSVPFAK